jgi:hypothetical protein
MPDTLIDLGRSARDLANDQTLGLPLPASGQINFGQQAQTQNRMPGTGTLLPLGPELQDAKAAEDSFWEWTSTAIDPTRWNKRYPYQLLVLNVDASGVYTPDPAWEFTLPFPPESLTLSTPFAINTQVTLGGIVEEHGGHPIKMLSFSGTTGVLPNKDTAAAQLGVPDAIAFTGGIAAGTIQNVVQTAETAAQNLGFTQFNLMNQTELDTTVGPLGKGRGTGYYQFRLLQKFLEGYANMKRYGGAAARRKRLAVAIWKDEAVYVVSPQSFEVRREAGRDPLGYGYTLSFKAWRRVKLNAQPPGALENYKGKRNDPAFLQSVLNVIQAARLVLAGAKTSLEAVRGDVDAVLFEPLRQTALLLKDGLGAMTSLAELPEAIAHDAATVHTEFSNAASLRQASKPLAQQVADIEAENQRKNASTGTTTQALSATPAAKLFANAKDNFELMSQIDVRKLQLRPATRRKILEEVERVRRLQRLDFELMRDQIQQVAHDFAAAIGEGHATFDDTYARPDITVTKAATDEDHNVLFALNNVIIEMSRMAVSGPAISSARVQSIDFVAGLARRSGIAFRVPTSKFAVPFPYGFTLEQLSARYLGDPNRWHEIATLNGLREPYVDEEGFERSLLTNGHKKQVVVSDITNLYVGQAVTVFATNTTPSRRRITSIEAVNPTMYFVNLDGEDDLARFTTMGSAKLHAYLPDTVNSQMMVYIPSSRVVEDELTTKSIPGVNDFTPLLDAGGVDLLLTSAGDMAITDDGDWKLAIGLTNLVQRVRIAFATPKGSLPQHPDYGLGLNVGQSTADMDAKQLLAAAKAMFRDDNDFAGVFAASILKSGPALRMSVSVGIAGQDIVIPVSVDVKR